MIKPKTSVDVIIVGAGIFGCMTAKVLRAEGYSVKLIDSEDKLAASKCAIGVYKEGWVANFKEKYKVSKAVLDRFDLVTSEEFIDMNVIFDENSKKEPFQPMLRVKCKELLDEKFTKGEVIGIENKRVTYIESKTGAQIILASNICVVVAAGYKNPELLAKYPLAQSVEPHWGAVLEVNKHIDESRIFQWAPYRQAVLLKTSEETFLFGDGTKIKDFETKPDKVEMASNRLIQHLQKVSMTSDLSKVNSSKEGNRPILPKNQKGNYVVAVDKNILSITGGGKSSSVLCGWVAEEVLKYVNHISNPDIK